MLPMDILHQLGEMGCGVRVTDDGKLEVRIPRGVTLFPTFREEIKRHKAEIISLLTLAGTGRRSK